jgi:predicted nucleic acid-binding protein
MDIYYLFHSEKGAKVASKRVKQIYALVDITSQTSKEVRDAFALGWTDFEDAMQMASAKNAEADKIITLDKKFQNKDKSYIWTPADLRSFLVQNVRD